VESESSDDYGDEAPQPKTRKQKEQAPVDFFAAEQPQQPKSFAFDFMNNSAVQPTS
jgi:hypothetical protein